MHELTSSRRIKILRDSVARKIAAGEVIDRPYAAVRELMDNAIDAGASCVSVYIEEGGIKTLRVVDDGWGMTKEDLEYCHLPHATSKIENAEDIYAISSLGFRGEALSSIAACSHLSIISVRENAQTGWKLDIDSEGGISVSPAAGTRGTIVEARDLFASIPGRRQFLKKPSTEAGLIRQTFLEKALPFPSIWFRLYVDSKLQVNLPPGTHMERVYTAYSSILNPAMLFEIENRYERFSLSGIFANPALNRKDRRYMHVYVNKRRVNEFGLIQAIEYGYSAYMPGGTYPAGFLFVTVDPELVDFNIHPAKREVKFRNLAEIHRNTVMLIQSALRQGESPPPAIRATSVAPDGKAPGFSFDRAIPEIREKIISQLMATHTSGSELQGRISEPVEHTASSADINFRYIGQLFSLFLLFEKDGSLYILDQHAAHERIIYDHLLSRDQASQPLLMPLELEVSDMNGKLLAELENIGCRITREKDTYFLSAVPVSCAGMENEIMAFLEETGGSISNLQARLFADIACKKAIKDGEVLDPASADQLIGQALNLPVPRCPHGRPVWFMLSRQELFQLLGRT